MIKLCGNEWRRYILRCLLRNGICCQRQQIVTNWIPKNREDPGKTGG